SFYLLCTPPRSPLFPYTTLFRSGFTREPATSLLAGHLPASPRPHPPLLTKCPPPLCARAARRSAARRPRYAATRRDHAPPTFVRSEEHTSELQSRFDLVCRLLLE